MKKPISLLIVVTLAASFLAGCDPQPTPTAGASKTMKETPKNKKLSGGFTDTE